MLRKFLADIIKIDGPISVAKYMQIALTHPTHGYYTGKEEVLGKAGDFTTSPEISQLFGETVGIAMLDWARHRRQQPVDRPLRLIELGPGKGTLMHDILGVNLRLPFPS